MYKNNIIILLFCAIIGESRCKKDVPILLTTTYITQITANEAKGGGYIYSGKATTYGVCWSVYPSPTINDSLTIDGSGSGIFSSSLTGLTPDRLYHVRSYGINGDEISYGNEVTFTTAGQKPEAETTPAYFIRRTAAVLTGIVKAYYLPTLIKFEYGSDTSYGQEIPAEAGSVNGNVETKVIGPISDLKESSIYHFRVVAENALGKTYGGDMMLTLSGAIDSVSDIDGNTYKSVVIDTQIWLTENLKVEHLNDGTPIAVCWYAYKPEFKDEYGGYYDWYTVNTKKLCPEGWHVPDSKEWDYLNSATSLGPGAGDAMREVGLDYWNPPNTGATNSSGFSARGGDMYVSGWDHFRTVGCWWSSTILEGVLDYAQYFYVRNDDASLRIACNYQSRLLNVRCIKD
jgi:uncharacterized protein (TIGR02145 family)